MTQQSRTVDELGSFNVTFKHMRRYICANGKKLSHCALEVYGLIWRFSRLEHGYCHLGMEAYVEELDYLPSAIRDAWKSLLAEGFIEELGVQDRKVGKDGRPVISASRRFAPTAKLAELHAQTDQQAATPSPDEPYPLRSSERVRVLTPGDDHKGNPLRSSEIEEREKRENPQTPRTFSLQTQNTNQGRDRKHQQFRGAGRNAKALKQAMLWDDDDNAQGKAPGLVPSTVTEVNPPAASRAPIVVTRVPDRSQRPTSDRGVGVEREDGVIKI